MSWKPFLRNTNCSLHLFDVLNVYIRNKYTIKKAFTTRNGSMLCILYHRLTVYRKGLFTSKYFYMMTSEIKNEQLYLKFNLVLPTFLYF